MESKNNYQADLTEIRSMMERSTRFLSLSGWSGVMAGIYGLIASYVCYWMLTKDGDFSAYAIAEGVPDNFADLLLVAGLTLLVAVGTAILMANRKSMQKGEKLWNPVSRRFMANMAIPLLAGGILSMILAAKGLIILVPAVTLLFYGMTLWTVGKFTFEEIKYLGVINIILGLIASHFTQYGLLFWAIGFGLMHIIYGIYLHLKYEK